MPKSIDRQISPRKRPPAKTTEGKQAPEIKRFEFKQIGVIRTPYTDNAPYQPVDDDEGDFHIVLEPRYANGLFKLATFRYIYVIYCINRVKRKTSMIVSPS